MEKGTCKHYQGLCSGCGLGINLADVTPRHSEQGWGLRIPCIRDWSRFRHTKGDPAEQGTCDKYEEPTPEEIAAEAAAFEASMQKHLAVGPVVRRIKQEHKGRSWQGVVDCPACGGKGTLHIRHSGYNGHCHGRCETEGCVAWME